MATDYYACQVCCTTALAKIPEFSVLPRVTSDCLPFRPGGRLLVCQRCGAAQSPADAQWFQEIAEIYGNYQAYRQAGGTEQAVVDPATGELRRRSEVLLDHLLLVAGVPRSGKVLDVGCGTGGTLRAFAARGAWRLCGLEMDTKNLPLLNRIGGFEALYTGAPSEVPGDFDWITLVHALEHFPKPLDTLCDLRDKLSISGRLFVQVPNADANPFDYLIADHMMHFTSASLASLAARAGFAVDCLTTTWVTKELSLMAHRSAEPTSTEEQWPSAAADHVRRQIAWLGRFLDAAREAAAGTASFGLFGTSIAATWLGGVLGDEVSFFLDEDPNRLGYRHLDRPVFHPTQAPAGSVVFLALVPQIAGPIAARLRPTTLDLRLPPLRV
jgi:SAM-dependent methyltransferase